MSDQEKAADTERKGNRLSKIVTRTGDAGTTGLGDGSRTTKDSLRIDAMGEVDELNSSLGVLLCEELPDTVRGALLDVQNDLFDLGGELCLPGMAVMKDAQVARLEDLVETFNADLPMLKEFILPGGTRAAALAHSGPRNDDDDAVIGEKVDVVRSTIQSMLNRGLKERSGVFW